MPFLNPFSRTSTQKPAPRTNSENKKLSDDDYLPPSLYYLAGGTGRPITVRQWNAQKPKKRMGGLLGIAMYGHKEGMAYERKKTEGSVGSENSGVEAPAVVNDSSAPPPPAPTDNTLRDSPAAGLPAMVVNNENVQQVPQATTSPPRSPPPAASNSGDIPAPGLPATTINDDTTPPPPPPISSPPTPTVANIPDNSLSTGQSPAAASNGSDMSPQPQPLTSTIAPAATPDIPPISNPTVPEDVHAQQQNSAPVPAPVSTPTQQPQQPEQQLEPNPIVDELPDDPTFRS